MDYQKFHRTNAVIEFGGSLGSAAWSIANLFLADRYAVEAYMPVIVALIIKNVRIIMLTGRGEYRQEEYAESLKSSYSDNRRITIFSAIFSCMALALIIIKLIIRQVSL